MSSYPLHLETYGREKNACEVLIKEVHGKMIAKF
jgi:hypothetical protein